MEEAVQQAVIPRGDSSLVLVVVRSPVSRFYAITFFGIGLGVLLKHHRGFLDAGLLRILCTLGQLVILLYITVCTAVWIGCVLSLFCISLLVFHHKRFFRKPRSPPEIVVIEPPDIMFEAEEEQQGPNAPVPMRERILNILGHGFAKRAEEIAFEIDRLADSKPAVMLENVSFEKLERLAPAGLSIVEICNQKLIINLDILDQRMPWGPIRNSAIKSPIFVDISQGLAEPRILNPHDLPDPLPDTVGNSNLYYKTLDLVDMMREIRSIIADGERIIEKKPSWAHHWYPSTIYGCLLGYPVVFWGDEDSVESCLKKDSKVWKIEWIDGEAKRPVYSFWVPDAVMNSNMKIYLQQWTDRIFDNALPHKNFHMLQTVQTYGSVMNLEL